LELSLILSIPLSLIVGFALALIAVRIGYRMGRETQGLATGPIPWREDAPGRTEEASGYADPWEEMQAERPKTVETVEVGR
jgi:hypothetical protein